MTTRFKNWKVILVVGCGFLAGGCTGWIAHTTWQGRNVNRAILAAYSKVQAPAQVIINKELELVTIKGSAKDVEQTRQILNEVGKAVKE